MVYEGKVPNPVVDETATIDTIPKWFLGIKLNFAENVLFTGDHYGEPTTSPGKEDWKIASGEVGEGCYFEPIRQTSWKELRERVGRLSQAMKSRGVGKGDRVAVVASSCLDTLTVFLAVTTLGGTFSSSSTDLGTKGILERLKQLEPKFVFFDDYVVYNKKKIDLRPKIREVVEGLSSISQFKGIVVQSRFQGSLADIASIPKCESWSDFIKDAPSSELVFERVEFGAPMIIVYSSGTTGKPKCIAHSVGGVVLSGHKESTLHRRVDHTSTQLQFTTTGWMMYMSSIQLLLIGARIIMYDGSPFVPDHKTFLRMVGEQKVTHLGISPRFMQTLRMNNIKPKEVTDLSHLEMVTSTGMVLSDSLFEWFYDEGFPPSVQLCNISGGTDIAAAFATGNPLLPVHVGGCQCIALDMAVSVYDSSIESGKGKPIPIGEAGELVCTEAFPTMPVCFWGEKSAKRYHDSYFGKYDKVWTHGDFVMIHPVTKQVFMLGRADGVLNPSGVRFGSSDIYSVIDTQFSDIVADSVCVGQRRPTDDDEAVILFLLMMPGHRLDSILAQRIRAAIRHEYSPRHVPKYIFETPEIPVRVASFSDD